jgi:hypothetical protein
MRLSSPSHARRLPEPSSGPIPDPPAACLDGGTKSLPISAATTIATAEAAKHAHELMVWRGAPSNGSAQFGSAPASSKQRLRSTTNKRGKRKRKRGGLDSVDPRERCLQTRTGCRVTYIISLSDSNAPPSSPSPSTYD